MKVFKSFSTIKTLGVGKKEYAADISIMSNISASVSKISKTFHIGDLTMKDEPNGSLSS